MLDNTLNNIKAYTKRLVDEYEGRTNTNSSPEGVSSAQIATMLKAGGYTASQGEILEDLFFRIRAWERAGAILQALPEDYYNAAASDAKRNRDYYARVVNEIQRAGLTE